MIKKAIETMGKWLAAISKTNDANVSETGNLHTVLVNLQIEDAHIQIDTGANTGIIPIAHEIERVINRIHDNTDDLRKTGRAELRQAFKEVQEYVNKMELSCRLVGASEDGSALMLESGGICFQLDLGGAKIDIEQLKEVCKQETGREIELVSIDKL